MTDEPKVDPYGMTDEPKVDPYGMTDEPKADPYGMTGLMVQLLESASKT